MEGQPGLPPVTSSIDQATLLFEEREVVFVRTDDPAQSLSAVGCLERVANREGEAPAKSKGLTRQRVEPHHILAHKTLP